MNSITLTRPAFLAIVIVVLAWSLLPEPVCMSDDDSSKVSQVDRSNQITLPPLPYALTSFGAVRHESALYVYGGNMGSAHGYYDKLQNDKLLKLDLTKLDSGWQELSSNRRLQGLGMVAAGQKLILLGGFTAMNAKGEKQDLHSQASVPVYDLTTKLWSELPALPEPRSSHDAAMIGNTIYVVGGWNMQGEGNTTWHTTAWSIDLSQPNSAWTELTKPPFVRRAVAAVAHAGKLFVIGGMDEEGTPTKAAAAYDPATKTWTDLAEIHGDEAMAGFGAAGWSIDGKLIVSTYEGQIECWNDSKQNWESIGKTTDARFFHRLLPLDNGRLVSLGGANMDSGKFVELEVFSIKANRQ